MNSNNAARRPGWRGGCAGARAQPLRASRSSPRIRREPFPSSHSCRRGLGCGSAHARRSCDGNFHVFAIAKIRKPPNPRQSFRSSSFVNPFFSPSLCARSKICQKSFCCANNMLSRSVSSVTGTSTAQGRPFFVITTDLSDGKFLMILLSLAFTSRRFTNFISPSIARFRNSEDVTTSPFCCQQTHSASDR